MTRGEVERIIAPYVKRIEALEKEVAELKAQPRAEQHTHYHQDSGGAGAGYIPPVVPPVNPVPNTPPHWPMITCNAGDAPMEPIRFGMRSQ